MRKATIFMLIVCMTAVLLAACVSNQFQKTYDEYKVLFISANDFNGFDCSGTAADFLRGIDPDEYEKAYNALKANRDTMNSIASTKTEKRICVVIGMDIDDMECVLYSRKNMDNLTEEEQTKLQVSLGMLGVSWDDYSEKSK